MKITENWIGTVEQVQYRSAENKSAFTKEKEPMLYICTTDLSEVGRGMTKVQQRHSVVFYLTKEQFDEKVIEKGDRIQIKEGAKWQSRKIEYMSYKSDVIARMDPSKLKVDEKGKPYYKESLYAYRVVCKNDDSWEMQSKWYDRTYCTISGSGVKLPLEDRNQFNTSDKLDWYLDLDELKTILPLNGTTQRVIAYGDKNFFGEKKMVVQATRDDSNNTNYLLLTEVFE